MDMVLDGEGVEEWVAVLADTVGVDVMGMVSVNVAERLVLSEVEAVVDMDKDVVGEVLIDVDEDLVLE